jgi:hypothetical protein
MYETGAIKVNKQTDILKFIAHCFQTQNTVEISVRSLRSKYYNIDSATREAVRDVLTQMLVKIDAE